MWRTIGHPGILQGGRSAPRRGFAAVMALLLLASVGALVVQTSRSSAATASGVLLDLQVVRARAAADAGAALARSAIRMGLEPEDVMLDASLPVITIEETTDDTGDTVWVIRGTEGVAAAERRIKP